MTMPVPSTISPAQTRSDAATRATDVSSSAGSVQDFSKVLSQQQPPSGKGAGSSSNSVKPEPGADKKQDPQNPDTTLALILDSAALPLMQVANPAPDNQAQGGIGNATSAQTAPEQDSDSAVVLPAPLIAASTTAASDLAQNRTPGDRNPIQGTRSEHTLPAQASKSAPENTAGLREPLPETIAFPAQGQTPAAQGLEPQMTARAPQATPQASTARISMPSAPPSGTDMPADTMLTPASVMAPPASTGLPATTPIVTLAVATPLASPQWAQSFGQQIVSFAQAKVNGSHTVQLHVNPPELGPVHITLQIGDSGTQAAFISPHAHVRQALESALPNLEQQFAQAGLSLGQANVSDQQAGHQGSSQPGFGGGRSTEGATFSLSSVTPAGMAVPSGLPGIPTGRHPDALVDTFA